MEETEFDQMSRMRDRLYRMVSDNPSGPDADRARGLLARMPKSNPAGSSMPAVKPDEVAASDVQTPLADRALATGAQAGQLGLTAATNAVNTASLGYYKKARDAAGSVVAPEATAAAQTMEQDAESTPAGQFVGGLGRGVGYLGGLPGMAGKAASKGVQMATEAAPKAIGRVLGARPVAGALTGGLAGGAIGGSEAAVQGEDLAGIEKAAKASAIGGALIGGGLGTAGSAVDRVAGKVNNSRGAVARRLIEEQGQGATVSPLSSGKGGVFDQELAGLPANDKGIGAASKIGAKKILGGVAEQHAIETSRPYRVMEEMINNSPEAAAPVDVASIVAHMQDAIYDLKTASPVRAQLKEQLDILERYRDPGTEAVMVPQRQLNGLRQNLMRAGKVGQSDVVSAKDAPIRQAAFIAKKLVDQGPYAELNQFYAEGMGKLRETRESLGLKAKPSPDAGVDVRKVKLALTRQGQNTTTGGGDANIEGFKQQNPALAQYADLPELQRAKADLSFHLLPQHGGIMPRLAGAAMGPGAAIGAAALGHGPAGLMAAGAMMAAQNATPIAGRLLYPLTRNLSTAGRMASKDAPRALGSLPEAIRRGIEAKRRRDMESQQ